jgi:proteasome lid subunit RPN8/RPN11
VSGGAAVEVFGLRLEPDVLRQVAGYAEAAYPREACGLILGPPGSPRVARVVPMTNVQDRLHRLDPARYPRDARHAFRLDELERLRLLEAADREGLVERVLFHSHVDVAAYLSPEDRAMAVVDGVDLLPGVVHLVVSVRLGRRAGAAAYLYRSASGRFEELDVPLPAP